MNKPAPLSKRQYDYFLRSFDSWFNVAEGGKRGGKNVLATLIFCTMLETHKNKVHLVAGVSSATAKLNILDCDGYGLLNYFEGRCREGKYKDRDCVYVQTKTGEKIVLVSGGGKDGAEKLIKGNTYGMAYVTEANECHPKFLKEVFDRTLSSTDRKIFHDLNPKEEEHWYYTDILKFHEEQQEKNPKYGYNYGHFTLVDNMSLSDEKIRTILNTYQKDSVWYKRDIRGDRAVAEGIIFRKFAENNEPYLCDDSELDTFLALLAAKPDVLMMNNKMLTKIRSAARRAGYYDRSKDDFGRTVETYNGILLMDAGEYYNGSATEDVVATSAPDSTHYGTSDIYAAKLGLDAFHGISVNGSKMLKTYLPDMSAPGAVKKGEVELIAGAVLKNSKMAGVLKGIKLLGKTS